MKGRHKNEERGGKLRRKVLGLPVVGWLLLAGAGIGLAAFFFALSIIGTIEIASGEVQYNVGALSTAGQPCTASHPNADTLDIQWQLALPDDQCDINLAFMAGPSQSLDMVLQSVVLPAGVTGVLGADCGKQINADGSSGTPGALLELTIDSGATPGTTIDLSTGTYFEWVQVGDYVGANCT